MSVFKILKKLPIDLGQKEMRHNTKSSFMALEFAGNGTGKNVLDAGCAEGFWSDKLKEQGWNVTSIDKETTYSSATLHDVNKGLPYPDQTFDLVFSTAVIAYVENPQFFVQEIKRVLKPDGRFVITTPNLRFWLDGIARLFKTSLQKMADQNQVSFFDQCSVKELFPKAHISGYFPYMVVKYKIKKLVGLLSPIFVITGTKSDL